MTKEELESKYIIAHVMTESLFKEDKSLLFDTKDEAKDYLHRHLIHILHSYWHICTVKEHNEICIKWWGNGKIAQSKSITLSKE